MSSPEIYDLDSSGQGPAASPAAEPAAISGPPGAEGPAIAGAAVGGFDLQDLLRRLLQRWKLILGILLAVTAVAVVKYKLTPPAYRAEAVIQIERRSLTPFASSQTPWLENWWNMEYYPTQYALLQSRGLAEEVIDKLDLLDDPAFVGEVSTTVEDSATGRPSAYHDREVIGRYANRLLGGLTVSPQRGTQLVEMSYVANDPVFAARVVNGFALTFIDRSLQNASRNVSRATSFLDQQIESLKAEINEREKELQTVNEEQGIIASDSQSGVTQQRLTALNEEYMGVVRDRIEQQSRYEELNSSPKETVADTQSSGLVSSLRKDLAAKEREYDTQRQKFKPDWPPLVELRDEIEKDRQYLDGVIRREADAAIQAALSELQTLRRQESKLSSEINRARGTAQAQNLAAVGANNLRTEIETRRQLLDDLLRKQSETAMAITSDPSASVFDDGEVPQGSTNVHLIEQALVPSGKFRPSLSRSLAMGIFGGFLLGIGFAFLLEYLDRSINTVGELEAVFGLPVLAVIPDVSESARSYGYGYGYGYGTSRDSRGKDGKQGARWADRKKRPQPIQVELAPHQQPKQLISEAYRSFRTSVLLSSAEKLQVLAITSAEAGEGKTVTIGNLAIVLAQLGRRVLLLDGDLRKPRQHQVFGLSNREGLVSYLTGSSTIEEIVFRTVVPNLFVAPAGPTPPNPSELLASDRMRTLIQQAREQFDFILIDTPPALAVTDATVAASLADGAVLCFRAGKVPREEVRACRDRLLRAEVRILGAVLNCHRAGGARYGRRYEGYVAPYGEEDATSAA
ncbi:MAG: polysaccharide biosynthesis tyrosine autokinase [Acidobacteriota bacterium]